MTVTASPATSCCDEYAGMSRRGLIRGAALLGATATFGSAVVTTSARPAAASWGAPARGTLVLLSLRGAADGLNIVVPHGDPAYYAARPRINVPKDTLLERDDFFGLHPGLKALQPMWRSGKLAAIHATGMPAPNRSHFFAMEEIEDADPGSSARTGWLNRFLGLDSNTSPLQGMHVGGGVPPTSMYGPHQVMSARAASAVKLAGDDQYAVNDGRRRSLQKLWNRDMSLLGRNVRSSFAAIDAFEPVLGVAEGPRNGATYPRSDLGTALGEVARILRGNVGVEAVTVDQGDWDMHTDMGNMSWGRMKANVTELGDAIAAFFTDLGPLADNVTLVTLSEFGRRVKENSSWGTDHGYGNVMFVAGAGVKGGKYYGRWPGLQNSLDADLTVTTDYRSVLSEVLRRRFDTSTSAVFPGFQPEDVGFMA
ncbi:DUF1501 domain-containing protein [Nocardioides sp. CFH 31398]|uniref:DUF1501 domain-containing protein n=1 Tax=Nocardioides sp. CFH 31398 TaxID=2919579 RepID=UPI001F0561F9|nr:DUF1501 domain-containing protein [Nocardioides sp. CFH 31398]MCH1866985.1 DUF1501 domain-containing protein [Nocardioides sp. CFH 31398]